MSAVTDESGNECCSVCYDKYTTVTRKQICCPKCNYGACKSCIQTYMKNIINDPHCMNCNTGWNTSFLLQNVSKTFINNDYAEHRKQILWRREEAYLPEAQLVAERTIRAKRMITTDINPLIAEQQKLQKQIDEIEAKKVTIYRAIGQLQSGREPGATAAAGGAVTTEKKAFVRKCTHTGCNGFLSTAWKCGICENYTCPDCLIIKGQERDKPHTCKEEDLATAKLIAKDTKMCPKCGEGIFRTEGCSQMFCTSCKTPFDWNTGKVISGGYIHNPHYFAYMRENGQAPGRAVGDILCGGMPHANSFRNMKNKDYKAQLDNIYRAISHCIDIEAPHYNAHVTEVDNQNIRVRYLLKEISKEEVESNLINQEKRRERHRVIREVLDTFNNVGAEIFRRFDVEARDKYLNGNMDIYDELWPNYLKELEAIRDYCAKELMDISYHYKCAVPQWRMADWSFFTESESAMRSEERNRILNKIAEIQKTKTTATVPVPVPAPVPAPVLPTLSGLLGVLPTLPMIPTAK
jgi:hypothetical protein